MYNFVLKIYYLFMYMKRILIYIGLVIIGFFLKKKKKIKKFVIILIFVKFKSL